MAVDKANLIWIDLEMTGLNVELDKIIEIATVVTDSELNTVAEGPVFAISQPKALLDQMDEWNTTHHNDSGLVERVLNNSVSEQVAEAETIAFLEQYVPKGISPMCGNSICQDRRFLHKDMRSLCEYFHYRNLDVSTLKILAQRWAPALSAKLNKEPQHLALADIYDSIEELRFYQKNFIHC